MKHLAQQAQRQLLAALEQLTRRFVLCGDGHAAPYYGLCSLTTGERDIETSVDPMSLPIPSQHRSMY